jgi:mono/diheme cytochrome c family protein
MRKIFTINLLVLLAGLLMNSGAVAAVAVEKFEIEGLISPASPKALTAALEEQLQVKVVNLNLKNSETGWPTLSVEFDSDQVTRETIEQTIAGIEDPAGHKYRVHTGPPMVNVAYTDEETKAMAMFGPDAPDVAAITSPVEATEDSIGKGKELFDNYCTTCHGLDGGGHGPAAHGITTFPRQLWAWNNADSSADGYLFWFITNGRNEMPPWGVILTENERWDVINYIKTLKQPE